MDHSHSRYVMRNAGRLGYKLAAERRLKDSVRADFLHKQGFPDHIVEAVQVRRWRREMS